VRTAPSQAKSVKSVITRVALLFVVLLSPSPLTLHQSAAATNEEEFVFPAEFERHEFVWVTWTDEAYCAGKPTDGVVLQIIKEISPFVKIRLVVKSRGQLITVKKILREHGISGRQVDYVVIPRNDRWLRDMGPIFVKSNKGNLKIVDFNYSFYGELPTSHPYSKQIERVDRLIAHHLRLPVIKSSLVSEGGDRESNGRGTMMVVEAVELQRNPDKTREEIEKELLRTLGQKKIIWLKKGPAEDDKSTNGPLPGNIYTATVTGGHIDEFCRFVDPHTILLAEVSPEERDSNPISRISYERLEENYRILREAKDQDGKPFRIIRVPAANHIVTEYKATKEDANFFKGARPGETVKYILAASYLNFFVTNGVVLLQSYWKEGRPESTRIKDEKAGKILQEAFPDRRIVRINAEDVNHGGGGIHCITQQQPARGAGYTEQK
jgi:agmatine deiminase